MARHDILTHTVLCLWHLAGSGVHVPLCGRVTIEGLQSNEAYSFAVAGKCCQALLPDCPSAAKAPCRLLHCHASRVVQIVKHSGARLLRLTSLIPSGGEIPDKGTALVCACP
jgi:hypothetical protein